MNFLQRGGIQRRLILITLIPAALLGVLLVTFFTHVRLDALDQEMQTTGQLIADQLAPATEYAVLTGNLALLENLVASSLSIANVQRIEVFDQHGQSLAMMHQGDLDERHLRTFTAEIRRQQVPVYYDLFLLNSDSVTTAPQQVGSVAVSLSYQHFIERQRGILMRSLLFSAVALLAALLLSTRLARALARPLVDMRNAVRALQEGHLDTRLQVREDSEIGELMSNLNHLAATLQAAEARQSETVTQLVSAREQAEQASRAKSDFLAMMSHELRTPLNGVMGMLQLLDTTELSGEQREYVSVASESTDHLLKIINDILDLSRIERDAFELEHIRFELARLLLRTTQAFDYAAGQRGLTLSLDIEGTPEAPVVIGDPTRLRQVLVNLLGNALKFTEQGSVCLRARWQSTEERRLQLVCEVMDTGIGIDSARLEQMFDAFQQEDSSTSRRFGGTGLGLAIARNLAHKMGGHLRASSQPGVGSCFTLSIPLELAAEAGVAGNDGEPVIPAAALQVLLVEDNPVNQMVMEGMLRNLHWPVVMVSEGQQALQLLQEQRQQFSLILMDLQLPDVDGDEVYLRHVEHCRQLGLRPLPCVAVTASTSAEARQRAEQAGMQGFLAKPVTRKALQQVLARFDGSESQHQSD